MSTALVPTHAGPAGGPAVGPPPGPATGSAAPRRPGRWPGTVLLLLLMTMVASYSAVAIPAALAELRERADRAAAVTVAQEGAAALLSYDYRDAEGSLARMQRYAVPALADRLEQTWPDMRGNIVFGQAVTTAEVEAAAVETLSDDTALVLVYLDQTTRTREAPTPTSTPFRVAVTVQEVDGTWMVAKVQPE